MKKIFWTSVFWIVIIAAFRGYLRWFDDGLAKDVSGLIGAKVICAEPPVTNPNQDLIDQIKLMQDQLNNISNSLTNVDGQDNLLKTSSPQNVKLYYFNQTEDQKLPINQQVNVSSVLPVDRVVAKSNNIIQDTINMLLEGNISPDESAVGFVSEFPNNDFRLLNVDLKSDGTLELTFNEVAGFTAGGSARVFILRSSIEKTAKQFSMVKSVKLLPESLFQP
ncbi:GerMN domain-containing protein [Candidatus Gracilibacteria bacterium]|nr:GerMN domain-containing protein [Candidatus Gracilibacteria bacterium]